MYIIFYKHACRSKLFTITHAPCIWKCILARVPTSTFKHITERLLPKRSGGGTTKVRIDVRTVVSDSVLPVTFASIATGLVFPDTSDKSFTGSMLTMSIRFPPCPINGSLVQARPSVSLVTQVNCSLSPGQANMCCRSVQFRDCADSSNGLIEWFVKQLNVQQISIINHNGWVIGYIPLHVAI